MLDCFCVLLCCYPYLAYSIDDTTDCNLLKTAAEIIICLLKHYERSYDNVPKVPATLMDTFEKNYKDYTSKKEQFKLPVLNVKATDYSYNPRWLIFFPCV